MANKYKTSLNSGGGGTTFVKMFVVSFLLHAVVIYLVPSVDILPSNPQYIEIETILIEEEQPVSSEAQALDPQEKNATASPQPFRDTVMPLSEYEPATPEMVSEQTRRHSWDFQAVQPPRLPQSLAAETMPMENQKPAIKPAAPQDVDVALLPTRESVRTVPKTIGSKTDRLEEQVQEAVITAEQPYSLYKEQSVSPVVQEDSLPALQTRSSAAMMETGSPPSLSEPAVVQPRLNRPSTPVTTTFNRPQHVPETPDQSFPAEKAVPKDMSAESVIQVASPDPGESPVLTTSSDLDPEFRPEPSLVLPKSQSQEFLSASQPVLKSPRQPHPDPPAFAAGPDTQPDLSRPATTMVTMAKNLPGSAAQDVVKSVETPELPPAEPVASEEKDESLRMASPLLSNSGVLEHSSYPLVSSAIRQQDMKPPHDEVETQPIALMRQQKGAVRQETPEPKIVPTFQTFSSVQIALPVTQKERLQNSGEENMPIRFVAKKEANLISSQQTPQYSSPVGVSFPRIQHVLSPRKVLVSAVIAPLLSTQKILTRLEDTLQVKKIAQETTFQDASENTDVFFEKRSGGQPRQQLQLETLRRPEGGLSRSGDPFVSTSVRTPVLRPDRRTMVLEGKGTAGSFARPGTSGICIRKETLVPDSPPPQKTVQPDDVVTQIPLQKSEEVPLSLEIEGPAARRQVISKPLRLPEIDLDVEVTIRLKFWVLPDGTVGEVIPLQRGDIRLERAAIQYLKSWRFTPLASGNQTVWGIIPITYTLQ